MPVQVVLVTTALATLCATLWAAARTRRALRGHRAHPQAPVVELAHRTAPWRTRLGHRGTPVHPSPTPTPAAVPAPTPTPGAVPAPGPQRQPASPYARPLLNAGRIALPDSDDDLAITWHTAHQPTHPAAPVADETVTFRCTGGQD